MTTKILIGAIAVVVIGGAVFFAATKNPAVAPVDEGNATTTEASNPSRTYEWKFEDSAKAGPVPYTKVALMTGGKTYPLGEYEGSCFGINGSAWSLLEGEISGAICWWAGGGTELGVFEESGKLVVKKGVIEEGSEEEPGFRGNFQTILTLE